MEFVDDSIPDAFVRKSLGGCIYERYAVLLHPPIFCITESSIPCCAAVVATPILKLWPACLEASMPICVNASLNIRIKRVFVRGIPFSSWNSGPGVVPLMAR